MVEVIVAILVLAFGLLGMAGTTALVVRQVTLADLATERSAVVQTTLEGLRALPFDSVRSGYGTYGIFGASWTVTAPTNQWKIVQVVTTGPGMTAGAGGLPVMGLAVPDTLRYRIVRP
jgi:Tfp pilus assembly protein PilV